MPLLNHTTKITPEETASQIMSILARKGASEIMTQHDTSGQPTGLKWRTQTPNGPLAFALPINAAAVFSILTRERAMITNPQARMEQATRTAWRITLTWVKAQMALIETEMVDMEEVFLPYMLNGGQTFYEAFKKGDLPMLPVSNLPELTQ